MFNTVWRSLKLTAANGRHRTILAIMEHGRCADEVVLDVLGALAINGRLESSAGLYRLPCVVICLAPLCCLAPVSTAECMQSVAYSARQKELWL